MGIDYKKIANNLYEIEEQPDMKVTARFYANDEILPMVTRDDSLKQLADTARLPYIESPVLGMPDMHQGQ